MKCRIYNTLLISKYYRDDESKKDLMGGMCSTHGKDEKIYKT
jgi:hypothetical protein